MRLGVGGVGARHCVVHWTLGHAMWEGAIAGHQVGKVGKTGVDIVVLRRDVLVVGIVSRHGVTDAETSRQQQVDGGDKIVAVLLMSSVPGRFKGGAGIWGRSQALRAKRVRHTGVRHGW